MLVCEHPEEFAISIKIDVVWIPSNATEDTAGGAHCASTPVLGTCIGLGATEMRGAVSMPRTIHDECDAAESQSHRDLLQAALALFLSSKEGGLVDGGSNIRHAVLRRMIALQQEKGYWRTHLFVHVCTPISTRGLARRCSEMHPDRAM